MAEGGVEYKRKSLSNLFSRHSWSPTSMPTFSQKFCSSTTNPTTSVNQKSSHLIQKITEMLNMLSIERFLIAKDLKNISEQITEKNECIARQEYMLQSLRDTRIDLEYAQDTSTLKVTQLEKDLQLLKKSTHQIESISGTQLYAKNQGAFLASTTSMKRQMEKKRLSLSNHGSNLSSLSSSYDKIKNQIESTKQLCKDLQCEVKKIQNDYESLEEKSQFLNKLHDSMLYIVENVHRIPDIHGMMSEMFKKSNKKRSDTTMPSSQLSIQELTELHTFCTKTHNTFREISAVLTQLNLILSSQLDTYKPSPHSVSSNYTIKQTDSSHTLPPNDNFLISGNNFSHTVSTAHPPLIKIGSGDSGYGDEENTFPDPSLFSLPDSDSSSTDADIQACSILTEETLLDKVNAIETISETSIEEDKETAVKEDTKLFDILKDNVHLLPNKSYNSNDQRPSLIFSSCQCTVNPSISREQSIPDSIPSTVTSHQRDEGSKRDDTSIKYENDSQSFFIIEICQQCHKLRPESLNHYTNI